MAQDRSRDEYQRADYREHHGRGNGLDDDYGHQRAIEDERRYGHHRERPRDEPYSREDDRYMGRRNSRDNDDERLREARRTSLDKGAKEMLDSYVRRVEKLEEEKKAILDDIKEVYGEAKAAGFDVPILRKVMAIRKKPAADRAEEEAILDLYLQALGML